MALELSVSALFHDQADLIEATVFLLDTDTDKFVPNLIKSGSAVLMRKNKEICDVDFDRRMGNSDGCVRVFFSHPPSTVNMQVSIKIDAGTDELEATVPVIFEPAEELPLHEQSNT